MKSSTNELKSRGFVDKSQIDYDIDISVQSLKNQLESKSPEKRTSAAITIKEKNIYCLIPELIAALRIENKLYSKIGISEALVSFKEKTIKKVIPLLGKIGKNQHKKLPAKPFKKDNYPLPRDTIARILNKIGVDVIPILLNEVDRMPRSQLLEAIDVMGNISYYHNNSEALNFLLNLFEKNRNDELMSWKIIRAFSAFPDPKIIKELEKVSVDSKIKQHLWEANRSLRLINKRSKA